MLIFKNNIYDRKYPGLVGLTKSPDPDYDDWFDPRRFVEVTLDEEKEVLGFIQRQPNEYLKGDLKKFYPHAHKTGGLTVLKNLLHIIHNGLIDSSTWYHMNTYHFCFLYDVLKRAAFNYNLDNPEERIKTLPELRGKPMFFDLFVKDYFFNTVFLLSEDRYNSLSRKEKLRLGYDGLCQFGVINGLLPTREEMELKESKDYPYSIYV